MDLVQVLGITLILQPINSSKKYAKVKVSMQCFRLHYFGSLQMILTLSIKMLKWRNMFKILDKLLFLSQAHIVGLLQIKLQFIIPIASLKRPPNNWYSQKSFWTILKSGACCFLVKWKEQVLYFPCHSKQLLAKSIHLQSKGMKNFLKK